MNHLRLFEMTFVAQDGFCPSTEDLTRHTPSERSGLESEHDLRCFIEKAGGGLDQY